MTEQDQEIWDKIPIMRMDRYLRDKLFDFLCRELDSSTYSDEDKYKLVTSIMLKINIIVETR